jgi:NTE family protein
MNGNEPSVAHDGATLESAAKLAISPLRSAALALLSAADIWSTNANTSAPKAAAPIEAVSAETAPVETAPAETASLEAVPVETAATEAAPAETPRAEPAPEQAAPPVEATTETKPRTVRGRLVAAIWPEEPRRVETHASIAARMLALGVPQIIRIPERATIENVLPQFASADEVQTAGLEVRSFSRRITAQDTGLKPWPPRRLSLALQGGGSFAAFTWGVLERLLEEPSCEFDVISGASAGAVNAALLVSGLMDGGREAARARLKQFWDRAMQEASFRSLMLIGGYSPAGSSISFGPALRAGGADPFDPDLLREALAKDINFAALQDPAAPKLLVAATRVRDGSLRIFGNQAITADTLLASTCPAQLHCAVEIDGESYWDGGYGANPPLVRLVQDSQSSEVLVVQVTPARDNYIPVTRAAIDRRLDQITANSVLNAEIAALEWARDSLAVPALRGLRLSRLAAENEIEGLAQRDPADLGRNFIGLLHRSGRAAADRWLSHSPDGKPVARVIREGIQANAGPGQAVSERALEPA